MDSQLFYLINVIFAVAFLLWFMAGRKNSGSATPLNLRSPENPVDYPVKYTPRERDVTGTQNVAEKSMKAVPKVLFMYNGHDWDAHEVLGVADTATLSQITEKYQHLVKASDKGKLEFLETAYKAILKKV